MRRDQLFPRGSTSCRHVYGDGENGGSPGEITEVVRVDPEYTVKLVPRSLRWKDQAETDRLLREGVDRGLQEIPVDWGVAFVENYSSPVIQKEISLALK